MGNLISLILVINLNYIYFPFFISSEQAVQENIMNVVAPQSVAATTQQPFSPTPDFNLTTMSENDLIAFINPGVFM